MMIRIRIATILAALVLAAPVFAVTPQLTEKVIINGAFGAEPDQYGRAGLGASTKTTRLVNCFAANAAHIAVHDRIKRDVKIYTPAGVFDKAIRLRLTGAKPDTVRARDIAPDEYGEDRQNCDRQPAPWSGTCHQKLLHFRPTMVANFGKISATRTNEVPLKPQTSKMLSLSIGACNRNNPHSGLVACAATQT
jgi:hypothetical protein